jgi:hypothetical protein
MPSIYYFMVRLEPMLRLVTDGRKPHTPETRLAKEWFRAEREHFSVYRCELWRIKEQSIILLKKAGTSILGTAWYCLHRKRTHRPALQLSSNLASIWCLCRAQRRLIACIFVILRFTKARYITSLVN